MALIIISDPVYFKDEAKLINQLFEAGMSIFHLRKPGINKSSYERVISEIDTQYHDRISLHQFHELRAEFPLIKRLHYPEQQRKTVFKTEYTLSTSIHHLQDFRRLKGFDYTFYGPVFNSISKLGYTGLSKADLVLPDKNREVKIIGLSGITPKNVQEVKLMGFDGLAVLGTIWNNKEQAVKTFKSLSIKHKEFFN